MNNKRTFFQYVIPSVLSFALSGVYAIFATLSSDEFKKTAAAKKNLCGCRSNWRLEAKKSPVVPGK